MVNSNLYYYFLDSSVRGIFFEGKFIQSWSPGCWLHCNSHKSWILLSHSFMRLVWNNSFGLGIKGLDCGWETTGQWPLSSLTDVWWATEPSRKPSACPLSQKAPSQSKPARSRRHLPVQRSNVRSFLCTLYGPHKGTFIITSSRKQNIWKVIDKFLSLCALLLPLSTSVHLKLPSRILYLLTQACLLTLCNRITHCLVPPFLNEARMHAVPYRFFFSRLHATGVLSFN